jgi:hypothetical protein
VIAGGTAAKSQAAKLVSYTMALLSIKKDICLAIIVACDRPLRPVVRLGPLLTQLAAQAARCSASSLLRQIAAQADRRSGTLRASTGREWLVEAVRRSLPTRGWALAFRVGAVELGVVASGGEQLVVTTELDQ